MTDTKPLCLEWQPIETCPEDGRAFLIFVPSAKLRTISLSRNSASWVLQEEWCQRGGYTVCDDHGRPVKATHWMPLPEAPSTSDREVGV